MAAQTLSAILDRMQTVLEAAPLSLVSSTSPFEDTNVPNALVDTTYRLTAGGVVSDVPTSNFQTVRVDRVTVTIEKMLAFDGYAAQQSIQDSLDAIERAIVADGTNNGYFASVEKGSRKVTRPKGTDVCQASLNFLVDYDFSEAS